MNNTEVGIVNGAMKNPAECRIAGGKDRWSNLATHPSTMSTVSTKSINPQSNPAQSCPIVPDRAISSLDAMQFQPPSCSKIATSANPSLSRRNEAMEDQTPVYRAVALRRRVKASQTPSKCFQFPFLRAKLPMPAPYIVPIPDKTHNPLCFYPGKLEIGVWYWGLAPARAQQILAKNPTPC